MSAVAQRQKLRTKTGCLTCRTRRKKCDEKSPTCGRCSFAGRKCQWPSSNELLDRRYASHPHSRHGGEGELSLRSELAAHLKTSDDLESFISRYFTEKFYGLLLLPDCHPDFQQGWIQDIQHLMAKNKSLYYSALTNAASHIYTCDHTDNMQDLALDYYSKSLRGLSHALSRPSLAHLVEDDGFLMSTMFLYLHGCMNSGTHSDIPPHLNAAMMILNIRLLNGETKISRPFERIALESVMFQIFLVNTELWSERMPAEKFTQHFKRFWVNSEKLVDRSPAYEGPYSLNSPVLGVPAPLFRLAMQAKEEYQKLAPYDLEALQRIDEELAIWNKLVLSVTKLDSKLKLKGSDRGSKSGIDYNEDATYLFVLIVSLLLEQMNSCVIKTESPSDELKLGPPWVPFMAPSGSWQIEKAMHIIQKYKDDEHWAKSFVGNWPVYTIGLFLEEAEHIFLVSQDLERRWEATRIMQLDRFRQDLRSIWATRGLKIP